VLKADHRKDLSLNDALALGVKALGSVGGEGGGARQLVAGGLEVAILDRAKSGRTFRRITGNALATLLPAKAPEA